MAVCFFDRNYTDKYRCSYEIKEGFIQVEVEYNIDNEIEEVNGIRIFSVDTKFRERDILIIDQLNKKII